MLAVGYGEGRQFWKTNDSSLANSEQDARTGAGGGMMRRQRRGIGAPPSTSHVPPPTLHHIVIKPKHAGGGGGGAGRARTRKLAALPKRPKFSLTAAAMLEEGANANGGGERQAFPSAAKQRKRRRSRAMGHTNRYMETAGTAAMGKTHGSLLERTFGTGAAAAAADGEGLGDEDSAALPSSSSTTLRMRSGGANASSSKQMKTKGGGGGTASAANWEIEALRKIEAMIERAKEARRVEEATRRAAEEAAEAERLKAAGIGLGHRWRPPPQVTYVSNHVIPIRGLEGEGGRRGPKPRKDKEDLDIDQEFFLSRFQTITQADAEDLLAKGTFEDAEGALERYVAYQIRLNAQILSRLKTKVQTLYRRQLTSLLKDVGDLHAVPTRKLEGCLARLDPPLSHWERDKLVNEVFPGRGRAAVAADDAAAAAAAASAVGGRTWKGREEEAPEGGRGAVDVTGILVHKQQQSAPEDNVAAGAGRPVDNDLDGGGLDDMGYDPNVMMVVAGAAGGNAKVVAGAKAISLASSPQRVAGSQPGLGGNRTMMRGATLATQRHRELFQSASAPVLGKAGAGGGAGAGQGGLRGLDRRQRQSLEGAQMAADTTMKSDLYPGGDVTMMHGETQDMRFGVLPALQQSPLRSSSQRSVLLAKVRDGGSGRKSPPLVTRHPQHFRKSGNVVGLTRSVSAMEGLIKGGGVSGTSWKTHGEGRLAAAQARQDNIRRNLSNLSTQVAEEAADRSRRRERYLDNRLKLQQDYVQKTTALGEGRLRALCDNGKRVFKQSFGGAAPWAQ